MICPKKCSRIFKYFFLKKLSYILLFFISDSLCIYYTTGIYIIILIIHITTTTQHTIYKHINTFIITYIHTYIYIDIFIAIYFTMASITNNTNNVNNNSTSPNRKYIDLLNNWAVKKKEELEHYNTVKNEYVGKTTNELWMILKGAQETRVLAYQALDSFWKEFLKTKDFQTFQYYCELSMKAFNDINLDIRNLQQMDNLKVSKQLIDQLQTLEKKKFVKLLDFYRSIAPMIVKQALELKALSPNAITPSTSEGIVDNERPLLDIYGTDIKQELQEMERDISEILQEIQINCM